jgi:branched-subunit amino acid aminotransferase/4-amino-4-deoxychorismate lyase
MFVREGRIKLPDRSNVLPGISMKTILELAELLEIAVDEGRHSTHDIYLADEALVSGTRYCLLPVATVNGVNLGRDIPGPVTRRLFQAWSQKVGLDFVHQALDHVPARDA